jgi:hypothetical protein
MFWTPTENTPSKFEQQPFGITQTEQCGADNAAIKFLSICVSTTSTVGERSTA